MASKLTQRHCPICTQMVCDVIYRVPADGTLAECDVVSCPSCGFTFSDTPTTQAEFDRYYAESKRYGPEVTGHESWNQERYEVTASRVYDLFDRRGTKVLDVGGGAGGLGRIMSNWGYNFDVTTCNVPLGDPSYLKGPKWHCVTLCHVLEHVRDLDPAMRNLSAIAETVYAEVPDAARYHEQRVPPGSDFNQEHINHFSMAHLRMLFEKYGFDLVACGETTCYPNEFPSVWGFFRRHRSLADAVRAQCDARANEVERYRTTIRQVPGLLIPWGIGSLAKELATEFAGRIASAVDSVGEGRFCGVDIVGPECCPSDGTIVITGVQHTAVIAEKITTMGIKNKVVALR